MLTVLRRPLCHFACVGTVLVIAFGCTPVVAHEGPPFPLLMDEPLAGHKISIWADPDIGEARFFIIIETAEGKMPRHVPSVSMWTEPRSGRLKRVTYSTKRQSLRNRLQFEVRPTFDQRDIWRIGVQLANPAGPPQEITTEVESTPPGFGPWDLAIYLFPFLLLGGSWVVAMVRRRTIWHDHLQGNIVDASSVLEPAEKERIEMGMDHRA